MLATDEDKVRLTNVLASRNHREDTGGPFAALVVDSATGVLVSAGVNVVLASGLSSTHAEVTALSLAQTRLGTWNLGAQGAPSLELVVNWRPCIMCYGAAMWSGVRRLVIAGDGPELETLTGFDEGPLGRRLGRAVRGARHLGDQRGAARRGDRRVSRSTAPATTPWSTTPADRDL